jgi:chorismate mutase
MQDPVQIPACRGVRGATVAAADTREAILEATSQLLQEIAEANDIQPESIASIFFTATADLTAAHPAAAARALGWTDVPLLCAREMDVSGGLKRAIRVLLHWNTTQPQHAIRHVYINGAEVLRPDLAAQSGGEALR